MQNQAVATRINLRVRINCQSEAKVDTEGLLESPACAQTQRRIALGEPSRSPAESLAAREADKLTEHRDRVPSSCCSLLGWRLLPTAQDAY